jgi:hypothetical protein
VQLTPHSCFASLLALLCRRSPSIALAGVTVRGQPPTMLVDLAPLWLWPSVLSHAGVGFYPSSGTAQLILVLLVHQICWPFLLSCCFSWMCWFGLNPNPSTPMFPTVLALVAESVLGFSFLVVFSSHIDLDPPPYGSVAAGSRHPPWSTHCLRRPCHSGERPAVFLTPSPPLHLVSSGGTRLITPSSPKDVHR